MPFEIFFFNYLTSTSSSLVLTNIKNEKFSTQVPLRGLKMNKKYLIINTFKFIKMV